MTSMKEAFRTNLPSVAWMSPSSSAAASAKLEAIADHVGFPRFVLNSTWLDELYSAAAVSDSDHVLNSVLGKTFLKRADVESLFRSSSSSSSPSSSSGVDRGAWTEFAHLSGVVAVNAYYNQVSNTIVVPVGALQPPLFWTRPKSLTFGAFGIVVGESTYSLVVVMFIVGWKSRFSSVGCPC